MTKGRNGNSARGLRLDAYVRVSRVGGRSGESFISPDVQREQVRGWAKLHGAQIVAEHEDLDRSGGTTDRPGFQTALSRIEARESDGLIVAKLDRFARSILGAYESIERIRAAGGVFVSVADQFDLSSSTGTLMFNILASFAQFERDRITESWAAAQGRAIGRGAHFQAPFGYRKGSDGRLVPVPEEARIVEEVFRRRADGQSWAELAKYLNASTERAPRRKLWTSRTATHIVRRETYLGIARHGEHVQEGAHEPIVSEPLWHAANAVRGVNPPKRAEPYLLTGLIRCAGCRHAMKGDTTRERDGTVTRFYRCRGSSGSGRCSAPATIVAKLIEPHVVAHVLMWAGHVEADAHAPNGEAATAREALRVAEGRLAKWRDDAELQEAIPPEQFRAGLVARIEAVNEAKAALEGALKREAGASGPVRILADEFNALGTTGRHELLRMALAAVFVKRGRGNVEDRALMFWKDDERLPDKLPGRGVRDVDASPIAWPDFDIFLANVPLWAWQAGHPMIATEVREAVHEIAGEHGIARMFAEGAGSLDGLSRKLGAVARQAREKMTAEEREVDNIIATENVRRRSSLT